MVDPIARAATALDQPITTPQGIDLDQPQDASIGTSLRSAFVSGNSVAAGLRARRTLNATFPPAEGFDPAEHIRGAEERRLDFLLPLIEADEGIADEVALTQSPEELDFLAETIHGNQERLGEAFENGALVGVSGMLAGGMIDLPTLLGGAGIKALATTARSLNAARVAGAARIAAVGAAEATTVTALEALSDPSIGASELALSAGAGAGFGAALGGAFPRAIANVTDETVEVLADDVADVVNAGRPLSAGAAAVQETAPAQGSSPGLSRLLPFPRSPKARILQMATQARDQLAPSGYTAGSRAFGIMNRLFRFEIPMVEEVGGVAGRQPSAQSIYEDLQLNGSEHFLQSQRTHREMLKDVYGNSGLTIRRRSGGGIPVPGHRITMDEFGAMSDELAQMRADGLKWELPEHLDLTDEQRETLRKHISKRADADDAFYEQWGRWEVETGLLAEEDLIPGYRPQRWDVEEILDNPSEFEDFLIRVFHEEPPADFLAKNGWTSAGEDFAALSKRDPDAAENAVADYAGQNRDRLEQARERRVVELEADLKTTRGAGVTETIEKLGQRQEQLAQRIQARQEAVGKARTEAGRLRSEKALARAEADLADVQRKLKRVKRKSTSIAALDNLIRRGSPENAKKIAELKKDLKKAEEALDNVQNLKDPGTIASEVRQQLTGSRRLNLGFVDHNLVRDTGRLKRRQIQLSKFRNTDDARRFLRRNSEEARQAFIRDVGPRIALRQAFGTDDFDDILKQMDETFAGDRRRAVSRGDTKAVKLLDAQSRQYREDLEQALKVFTGKVTLDGSVGAHFFASQLARVNVVSMLGSVFASLVADLAVKQNAGGKLGTVVKNLAATRQTRRILKQLEKSGQDSLRALILGTSNVYNTRIANLVDIDDLASPRGLDSPHSWLRNASRGLDKTTTVASQLMMRLNFMNWWNRWQRSTFGVTYIDEVRQDVTKFGSLSKDLRTFYARHGIDAEMARRIDELYQKHVVTVEGVPLPDEAAWSAADPAALRAYRQAVNGAANEAIIDPSLGDTPWLQSRPVGRLILQFSGFPYAAQNKFLRPAVQARNANTAVALTMALALGALSDGLKAAIRGDVDGHFERIEENPGQLLYGAWVRSPLAVGPSATLAEFGIKAFGRRGNDLAEATLGIRPLPQSTKFQERGALTTLLGPSFGTAERVVSLAQLGLGGVTDENERALLARRAASMAPYASLFYIRWLSNFLEENLE